MLGRQEDEADPLVVGQRFQRVFQRPPGGFAAGGVAVESKDDAVDLAQQLLHVGWRRCRAQRRHRVTDAVLGQGDDVHVAFGDDRRVGGAHGLARLRQAEQFAAFFEKRGFRRVQVFRFALVDDAAAEGDDVALGVDDGDHQAVAEAVVTAAGVIVDDQAGQLQGVAVVIGEDRLQVLPAVRGVADAEAGGGLAGQAAALAVVDGARRLAQLFLVPGGGAAHDLDQIAGVAAAVRGVAAVVGDGHAGARRQFAHGVDETHALVFHDETDGGAVGAAAEAVVELLARADRERRRLFVVEGAAGGVIGARLLQRYVAVDQVDDVDPGQQILDEVFRDHGLRISRRGRP
ncbi:hypothetical protein SDC9_102217 [bioreactor metagenome]|uniref:Uncharacterized protein n=1 Tax=bioreactor metagenome TaxID=1076179 RepID=A0A645AQN1_9ZZZZ